MGPCRYKLSDKSDEQKVSVYFGSSEHSKYLYKKIKQACKKNKINKSQFFRRSAVHYLGAVEAEAGKQEQLR